MPIASYKNALFLHNEVPGIKMSDEILQQFEAVKDDKAKTRELSLKLSKDLIDTVHEYLMVYTLSHRFKCRRFIRTCSILENLLLLTRRQYYDNN